MSPYAAAYESAHRLEEVIFALAGEEVGPERRANARETFAAALDASRAMNDIEMRLAPLVEVSHG